jgi:hypothetical protein
MEGVVVKDDGLTIVVPWERMRDLSQNSGSPIWKAGAIKRLRAFAWRLVRAELAGRTKKVSRVTYAFWVPDNRKRDEVNMLQNCKPIIDGAIDAGLAKDDSWQALRMAEVPTIGIDRERPRVEVTFFGDEDEDQTKSAGSSKGVGKRRASGPGKRAEGGPAKRPADGRRKRGDTPGDRS